MCSSLLVTSLMYPLLISCYGFYFAVHALLQGPRSEAAEDERKEEGSICVSVCMCV